MSSTPDPYITCPYDVSHRILSSRMQFHLVRCRQNHLLSEKAQCPFNALHIINKLELNYHISVCTDGANTMLSRYVVEEQPNSGIIPVEDIQRQELPDMLENWDQEPPVATYDPLHNIEERNILRIQVGLSKAKKKEFRLKERRRIQALEGTQAPTSNIVRPSVSNESAGFLSNQPLRPPRQQPKALDAAFSKLSLNSTEPKGDIVIPDNKLPLDNSVCNTSDDGAGNVHKTADILNKLSKPEKEELADDKEQHLTSDDTQDDAKEKINADIKPEIQANEIPETVHSDDCVDIEAIQVPEDDVPFVVDALEASSMENFRYEQESHLPGDSEQKQQQQQQQQQQQSQPQTQAQSKPEPQPRTSDFDAINARLNALSLMAKQFLEKKIELDEQISKYMSSSSEDTKINETIQKLEEVNHVFTQNTHPDQLETNVNTAGLNRRCAANFTNAESPANVEVGSVGFQSSNPNQESPKFFGARKDSSTGEKASRNGFEKTNTEEQNERSNTESIASTFIETNPFKQQLMNANGNAGQNIFHEDMLENVEGDNNFFCLTSLGRGKFHGDKLDK